GNIYPVGVYAGGGSNIQNFVFSDVDGNAVIDDTKSKVVLPTTTQNLAALGTFMSSLTFSGKVPVVDKLKKELFLTVPESKMNSNQTAKVVFGMLNSVYQLYINSKNVKSGDVITYYAGQTKIPIEVRNGTSVLFTGQIVVTCLPLVQLYTDSDPTAVYNLGRVVVTEADSLESAAEIMLSNLKLRGDYASRVDKKAYALKLKDVDGSTSMNRSFFGLRSDNNWILDAMYIDPARMRNRVSTDFWLDFSTKPYYAVNEPKMLNGTRGKFVEVFLNDSYNGLYCMTEKIDRKQLNLKKLRYSPDSTVITQRGGLYKASNWSIGTQLGNSVTWGTNILPAYDNNSETWTAFDNKYPDLGDGEPIEWKPAYDAVRVPYWQTDNTTFTSKVATYFDLPVFIDYYLLLDLMLASDNHGKNYYLSVYDQSVNSMVSLTPWDMDGVWGRRWNGTSNLTYANQSLETFILYNEPRQNNLYLRMLQANTENFNNKLKIRYKELRGSYFTLSSIMARFYKYNELFKLSGASTRERTRWAIGDFNTEMTFLSTWITARLKYLDLQYIGSPYTGVDELAANNIRFSPSPVKDLLTVYDVKAGDMIQIISLQGAVLQQVVSGGENTVVDMSWYNPGVYLIRVGGNTTKIIKN
ncbi:MAG TPA: CotH kinase family protein, partial [Paludibacter sp.]